MRFSATLSLLVAAVATFGEAQVTTCNANNCLRAVRASNFPSRPTVQDCRSFVVSTVTATTTVISTTTTTPQALAQRAATTSPTIPAYATGACNTEAYISACRCIGVVTSTTTVSTVTVVQSTTVAATPTGYRLVIKTPDQPDTYVGTYPQITFPQYFDWLVQTDSPVGTVFSIDPSTSQLLATSAGRYTNRGTIVGDRGAGPINVVKTDDAPSGRGVPSRCSISADLFLTCLFADTGNGVFFIVPNGPTMSLFFTGEENYQENWSQFVRRTISAVPLY